MKLALPAIITVFAPFRYKHLLATAVLLCLITSGYASGHLIDDVVQVSAEDTKKMLKEADRLIRAGNYPEATTLYRRVIQINPADSLTKLKLSRALLKQQAIGDAYQLSFDVAKAEPENAHAFAVLGTTLLAAGRFDESRPIFNNALNLDKKEALAWYGIGLLSFYENKPVDAIKFLREAVFHDPLQPDFFFSLGQVSARTESYKQAADAYKTYLSLSRNTDDERRDRIMGLIGFLEFLGHRRVLYNVTGTQSTIVKFDLIGNRPVIELKINGKEEPLRFVLDTGSGISVISEETATRLNLKAVSRGGTARAIGGTGQFEIVYGFLKEVSIGEVNVRNVPVYIRKFHNQAVKVDGYIGLSLISKFLTTIDYGDQTFSLIKRDTDDPETLLTDTSEGSIPLRLTSSGFLSGEVMLEGLEIPLNFIVDTGASISVVSEDVASLDVFDSFERGETMRVIGAAGITDGVPSFMLPKISFGMHSRNRVPAIALDLNMINEASGFVQAGILGGNFLRNYRLTFDFKSSRVLFTSVVKPD